MTKDKWTPTQIRRMSELGLDPNDLPEDFTTPRERDREFQKLEKKQVQAQRKNLNNLLNQVKKTQIQDLRERIEQALFKEGFTGVSTPIIMKKQALEKMTISEDHPLAKQIFWLNSNQCLRPMLAPNLYSLMQDFSRSRQRPIRFFEIGSCFRKESSGARHSNEFTMLNLVEMGTPEQECIDRLKSLARMIMAVSGIEDYLFESEDSAVYGSTLDVVSGAERIEVASGAVGPHPLDAAWDIIDTWVGIGFGLERLLMTANKETSIGRWVKSLSYLDGICLNI